MFSGGIKREIEENQFNEKYSSKLHLETLGLKAVVVSQQTFTCSKSTIETMEKDVKLVNNKNTRTISMMSF